MHQTFKERRGLRGFLLDLASGFGMGVAFIIPGFSGGSVAVILGIYERLISAIANIFKDFWRSVKTLFPIFLGLAIGAVSLLFPLRLALEYFPLPTVSLFVGLAIGGIPTVTDKIEKKKSPTSLFALFIPLALALSLSFLPVGAEVDLFGMNFGGYVLLFIIGVVGSSALVIPGISGSMLLLILGYYNPLIRVLTDNLLKGENVLSSLLILATAGMGIIVGFIAVSVIMKLLLERCPRGTYLAIVGFIIGSLPTVFISTAKEAGMTTSTLPASIPHWIACIALLALGFALSFGIVKMAKKHSK